MRMRNNTGTRNKPICPTTYRRKSFLQFQRTRASEYPQYCAILYGTLSAIPMESRGKILPQFSWSRCVVATFSELTSTTLEYDRAICREYNMKLNNYSMGKSTPPTFSSPDRFMYL